MNPTISGQNTAQPYTAMASGVQTDLLAPRRADRPTRSGVQADLLVGRREGKGDLKPAFLAEHEAQLARRPQTLGAGGTKRGAGAGFRHRTEEVLVEEAVLTACFA
jgi:hypothetical protein